MDICIVTNYAPLARFLVLELEEAGYTAEASSEAVDARLCICDLDFCAEVPGDAVGFSYDESKRTLVQSFLSRPIDTKKLREAVAKRLNDLPVQKTGATLEIERATRKVKTDDCEVRLSEKELRLLELLTQAPLLTREDGAKVFGDGKSNVVDVYMHYLRKKLALVCDGETVLSKRGEGYTLSDTLQIKFI